MLGILKRKNKILKGCFMFSGLFWVFLIMFVIWIALLIYAVHYQRKAMKKKEK